MVWEIVRYLELRARIEEKTAMILSANGFIFDNTGGKVSSKR
jgi:hypothetical protein